MENAVDAIKMAFAIFIFVTALSITMYMFTKAKTTSDLVLQASDVTEYMEYTQLGDLANNETMINNDRIVGLETIIPTLYKYYKENYTVIFMNSNGTPMDLYTSQTNEKLWSKNYVNKYYKSKADLKKVCSFDVDEETSRREPWTGNMNYYKKNLDMFLSGKTFYAPSLNGMDYDYSKINGWLGSKGFIEQFKDKKFRESLGEYTYNKLEDTDDGTNSGLTNVKGTKKRVIIYTLMS